MWCFANSRREQHVALERTNVLCLPALLAFRYGEFNSLSLFQTAVSAALDGGEMHEYIFPVLT